MNDIFIQFNSNPFKNCIDNIYDGIAWSTPSFYYLPFVPFLHEIIYGKSGISIILILIISNYQ